MPAPFLALSTSEFAALLAGFRFTRKITAVHMHHTWRPNHAQWKGLASMEGMHRSHTVERGFSDIAQHLTIDPTGRLWTGRNWNQSPASATGHNGNATAGPFMIEVVGDFDLGRDTLAGAQRSAVLDVIALINQQFGLHPESLLFHNQVAAKSCPGTGIDRTGFVAELGAHRPASAAAGARGAAARAALPFATSTQAFADVMRRMQPMLTEAGAGRGASAVDEGELDYLHAMWPDSQGRGSRSPQRVGGLTPDDIDRLRPHVINLRMGAFSEDGLMHTRPADIDALFGEHLPPHAQAAAARGEPLRIVLYAHGGLVSESSGLGVAARQVAWWLDNRVYPVHFVWETGLFETLASLLMRGSAEPGTRGLVDRLTDPLLEEAVRALGGVRIWGAMKASAQLAHADDGGARLFIRRLKAFIDAEQAAGRAVELHAVGHSAGAIFMAHGLQALKAEGGAGFKTLQFLAPAVRVDTFNALVAPAVGPGKGVGALTVYTMRRDFELDDNCAGIYRKSLLYLVSEACEPQRKTPILGLEVSLRDNATTRALFGLGQAGSGHAELVWSKGPGSTAVEHGGFDDDAPTMNSVLHRVLGIAGGGGGGGGGGSLGPVPFPGGSRGVRGSVIWADEVDWPPALRAAKGPAAAPGAGVAASAPHRIAEPAPAPQAPQAPAATPAHRRALCVGIDTYAVQPLAGCVNDSKVWAGTLTALGFTVTSLHNEQARREDLLQALGRLVDDSAAGDELVFQFAGHGSQLPDLDEDERSSDSPGKDEALCPHDFHEGRFVLDDEIDALCARVPEGAQLTLFMDCCHSGDIGRLALDDRTRARRVVPTPAMLDNFRAFRQTLPRAPTPPTSRAAGPAPQGRAKAVVFSACRSRELAWETEGQGDFTRQAVPILRSEGATLSNRGFIERVRQAFGDQPRQNPNYDAPPDRQDAALLGGRA